MVDIIKKTPAGICCDAPNFSFDWSLGANANGEAGLLIANLRCLKCGQKYQLVDDEGELREAMVIDIFLEKKVRTYLS